MIVGNIHHSRKLVGQPDRWQLLANGGAGWKVSLRLAPRTPINGHRALEAKLVVIFWAGGHRCSLKLRVTG
jgi:hypothetical protein